MAVGRWRHVPAPLPRKRDPVPIVQRTVWAPGSVWTGAEKSRPPPTGIRSLGCPASSELLYRRLRHPAPQFIARTTGKYKRLAIECWVANSLCQVVRICVMFLVKQLNNFPSILFGLHSERKFWLSQLHRLFCVGRLIADDKRWRSRRKVVLLFLGTFAKLRRETVRFVVFARLSAWKSRIPLDEFREIWCMRIFRKSVEKIQVWQNCF